MPVQRFPARQSMINSANFAIWQAFLHGCASLDIGWPCPQRRLYREAHEWITGIGHRDQEVSVNDPQRTKSVAFGQPPRMSTVSGFAAGVEGWRQLREV